MMPCQTRGVCVRQGGSDPVCSRTKKWCGAGSAFLSPRFRSPCVPTTTKGYGGSSGGSPSWNRVR